MTAIAFISCTSFKRGEQHQMGWCRCDLPRYHAGEHRCACGDWWHVRHEERD